MSDEETKYLDPDETPFDGSDEEPDPLNDPEKSELLDPAPDFLDPDESPLDGSLSLKKLVESVFRSAPTFGIDERSFRRSGDSFEIRDGSEYREMTSEELVEFRNSLERIREKERERFIASSRDRRS